jgi:hypothetical protein
MAHMLGIKLMKTNITLYLNKNPRKIWAEKKLDPFFIARSVVCSPLASKVILCVRVALCVTFYCVEIVGLDGFLWYIYGVTAIDRQETSREIYICAFHLRCTTY